MSGSRIVLTGGRDGWISTGLGWDVAVYKAGDLWFWRVAYGSRRKLVKRGSAETKGGALRALVKYALAVHDDGDASLAHVANVLVRDAYRAGSRANPSSRSPWPKPWKPWEKQAAHRVRVESHRRGRGKTAFDDHHEVAVYELSKGEWQAQAIDHRHFRHVWFDEPATSVGNALSLLRRAAAAEGWPYPALVRRLSRALTGGG